MSEQQTEQSGGETGSLGAGSAVPNSPDPVMTSVQEAHSVESPAIVPEVAKADETTGAKTEMPKAETPKVEPLKVDAPAAEASKLELPKSELPKSELQKDEAANVDAPKAEVTKIEPVRIEPVKAELPRAPRELLIMSPRDGSWKSSQGSSEKASFEKNSFESRSAEPKLDKELPPARNGGRRFAAMAAMLLLAVIAGAAGGAFATAGLSHFKETAAANPPNNSGALDASVARIDADIVALKAGLEQATKTGQAQFNKTSDRLEKTGERLERVEKAQAEPAAKLAKLSEAVDKLRTAAPAQAAAPVTLAAATPKDVTGTVTAPSGAQALPMPQASPAAAANGGMPKPEIGRLPTVEGWILRDAGRGSALIEGRTGLYEVFAGDPIPGVGRVEAIRKQDGRWVVVTPKGLIVAR